MRHYYAQIDAAGNCVGVIDTHAEIQSERVIAIPSLDATYIGRVWSGGAWQS